MIILFYFFRRKVGKTCSPIWVLDFLFALLTLILETVRLFDNIFLIRADSVFIKLVTVFITELTVQTDLQAGAEFKYGVSICVWLLIC